MVDLAIKFCGLELKNPVCPGSSGLTGEPEKVRKSIDAGVGAIVGKTVTTIQEMRKRPRPYFFPLRNLKFMDEWIGSELLEPQPPEKWLENKGKVIVKLCHKNDIPYIASIMAAGDQREDWAKLAKSVESIDVDAIELNFSCPRVMVASPLKKKQLVASDPLASSQITEIVAKAVSIPVIPKLSPLPTVTTDVALACEKAGADGIAAFNTTPPGGLTVDVEKEEIYGLPVILGYMPGKALKPLSLAMIANLNSKVKIPVSGIGGIWSGKDALEYILLGCSKVQVVSAVYQKGYSVLTEIVNDISSFMERKGYGRIDEFKGNVLKKVRSLSEFPMEETWSALTPILPVVDKSACTLCGQCEKACINEGIHVNRKAKTVEIKEDKCQGCGMCVALCPVKALRLQDRRKNLIWKGEGTVKSWLNMNVK